MRKWRKIFSLFLILVFARQPSFSGPINASNSGYDGSYQVGGGDDTSFTADFFCILFGNLCSTSNVVDDLQRATQAGVLSDLRVNLVTAPSAGDSWACTVRINNADSDVTCTISGTDTECDDLTNSAVILVDDDVGLACIETGTADATQAQVWTFKFKQQ